MPDVAFYPLEAAGKNYPRANFPFMPHASWRGLFGRKQVDTGSAFAQGGSSFIRGRYALAEAMRRAGAGQGKAVLLPAFHCRAMVEPALFLGARPCFYPVTADLRPDFSALSALLSEQELPVAAMVVTHYFCFPNEVDEAERFCAAHGIALIEDCAHALYGRAGQRLLGTVGSYATASVWKFLPVGDGAILLDNTGRKSSSRTAQPWIAELKALVALLQASVQRGWCRSKLDAIDAAAVREQAKLVAARPAAQAMEPGLKEFSPKLDTLSALRSLRGFMAHAPHERIASRRRANYLKWLEGMRSVPGVKPLFPILPEGVVPYAFPLLVDASGMGFHLLKMAGIPLLRWEDMALTDCAISRDYRVRLLQLPCHQELREQELDWMMQTVQVLLEELN